jgi:hypothetical protein
MGVKLKSTIAKYKFGKAVSEGKVKAQLNPKENDRRKDTSSK